MNLYTPHERGFKQRAYPTNRQAILLNQYFGARRFVYNWALAAINQHYAETGKHLSVVLVSRELTKLKQQPEFSWMRTIPSSILQQSLRDLDAGFQRFFKAMKAGAKPPKGARPRKDGKPHYYPRFRKRGQNDRIRFQLDPRAISEHGSRNFVYNKFIDLPAAQGSDESLGRLKTRWDSRAPDQTPDPLHSFEGAPKSISVRRDATGKYFLSFMLRVHTRPSVKTKQAVGVDLGIKSLFVTSTNHHHAALKPFRAKQRDLAILQRKRTRKQKGSKRSQKHTIRIAAYHAKITNARADALHKATASIVRDFDLIAIEDLNVAGMMKNHKLSKSLADASFGEFRRQLTYKCKTHDKDLVVVSTFFPSTKMCCVCGQLHDMPLKQRVMDCDCGNHIDRDHNAAINIRNEGLYLYSKQRGHDFYAPYAGA